MPIGGLISGLGALAGGIFGSNAASSAAKTQAQSADKALTLEEQIMQTIQGQLAPFTQTGTNALASLAALLGLRGDVPGVPTGALNQSIIPTGFQQSPGYQWQLQQGEQAIQDSAAGKTGAVSGNMLKALQTYGTGLANQDYWNWFENTLGANIQQRNATINPLLTLAGMGQNAAAQTGASGLSFGNTASNLITGQGNALASGQVGSANALQGGLMTALQSLLGSGNNSLSWLFGNNSGSPNSFLIPGTDTPISGDSSFQFAA